MCGSKTQNATFGLKTRETARGSYASVASYAVARVSCTGFGGQI